MDKIGFNKPYLTGKEIHYLYEAFYSKKLSGDGKFTKLCHDFFEKKYGFKKCLLTTSCTDAMELAALLLDIKPGDEVIAPSYTFVSTVNPFVLRGAKIVFTDSRSDQPNIDENKIEELINKNTRAIIVVHYAGVACEMGKIISVAKKNNLKVIEDAAHSVDSYYKNKPLGSLGDMSAFSFHETKNIITGEGGMLVINESQFFNRAEILREKGTNRSAFFRGEVDKYSWVDIGSSFLPSEIIAAFLFAQLEFLNDIQDKRKKIWNGYQEGLVNLFKAGKIILPVIPDYATNNAHMYYLICESFEERSNLLDHLKKFGINAVFHYLPLHKSEYYINKHDGRILVNSEKYSDCLLRLPLYPELSSLEIEYIIEKVSEFFN